MLKNDWFGQFATATPAIAATHGPLTRPTIATVATIAVANPTKPEAANDQAIPKAPEPQSAPAPEPADWKALDRVYQAHHVNCPTCIAAGKGYGQRCGTGAALWVAYDAVDMPQPAKVQPAPATPQPAATTTATGSEPTAVEAERTAKRLALFVARGLTAAEAERLADKLLMRDREGDRRGACAECINLKATGPARWQCADNNSPAINELAGANLSAAFVHLNLHRCKSIKGAAS